MVSGLGFLEAGGFGLEASGRSPIIFSACAIVTNLEASS